MFVLLMSVLLSLLCSHGWKQGQARRPSFLSMTSSVPRAAPMQARVQALSTVVGATTAGVAILFAGASEVRAYGPVDVNTKAGASASNKKTKKAKQLETDLGIPFVELKKGEGAFPNPGDFVAINYIGFLPDGTVFDETHEKKALSFTFGKNQVIPGMESVIAEMQPGGEITTIIPAKYAYGSKGVCVQGQQGKECLIQPDTPLKYFIKLKRVGAGYN